MSIPIYFYIILLAIIIWFNYQRRLIDLAPKRLIYYLVFMFCAEVTAWLYAVLLHKWNHWIFNIILIIQVSLSLNLFHPYAQKPLEKITTKNAFYLFLGLYVLNLLIAEKVERFDTTTFDIAALFVIYFSLLNLKDIVFSQNLSSLKKNSLFWICTANLIYWAGSLFYMGLINYIVDKRLDPSGSLLNILVYTFSAIQYSLFIVGILCNLNSDRI